MTALYSASQDSVREAIRNGKPIYFRCLTTDPSWPQFHADAEAHVREMNAPHVELGGNYAHAGSVNHANQVVIKTSRPKEEWIGTTTEPCVIEIYDHAPRDVTGDVDWKGPPEVRA